MIESLVCHTECYGEIKVKRLHGNEFGEDSRFVSMRYSAYDRMEC